MDEDVTRRLVKGILTLVLTTLATWLAGYITVNCWERKWSNWKSW